MEEGWVVCRAFKKRTNGQNNKSSAEGWDPGYFYDEPSGISSVIDPTNIEYISRHGLHNFSSSSRLACKQETEGDNLNFINNLNADHFLQLPQLESPSLPLMKRPISSVPEEEPDAQYSSSKRLVTDWRALDKFVASQLSHEERYSNNNGGEEGLNNNNLTTSFTGGSDSNNCSDQMAFLLMQSGTGRDERNIDHDSLMSGFLNSSSDCDVGICIFDK
ncbi:hypothetical protein CDL15_Pgr020858 [Punica granatum]|uniref:NAC domain-containing protein n=1 Tax=Punica granatum TaxID=22663 RepID=A0A218XVB8_PUNGR|nr:hypothetical protein CDL15_Pgr020858 [Punica granatum]PKI75937.1 hypothetical protein CRG98_003671 [Punica granatum]